MQTKINYGIPPKNYAVVDKFLSRSAQPDTDNLRWIKQQRVTDIVNFRTMAEPGINFDEKNAVQMFGMRYHNIPSITARPEEKNIINFLNLIEQIKGRKGKAHIHCKAGADRTGMYTFFYKGIYKIGSTADNINEWLKCGHNKSLFPNLIPWSERMLKHLKKQYK